MSERIISVAISAFGIVASLPAPARHGDVLRKMRDWPRNRSHLKKQKQPASPTMTSNYCRTAHDR